MFKKFVTCVNPDGTVTVDKNRDAVADADVHQDMDRERERISRIAQSGRSRILSIEQTNSTIVIVYIYGAVKVYHWVAE